MTEENSKNGGEGSRTAAAAYNGTRRFVESEEIEAKAQEAADAPV